MYVALTRAEEILCLTYCSKRYLYSGSQYQNPSRFCKEIGLIDKEPKIDGNMSRYYDKMSSFTRQNLNENFKSYNFKQEDNNVNKNFFNKSDFFKQEKEEIKPKKDVSIYKVGQKVFYNRFGNGEIVNISDDGLVADIVFEDFGKKSLMLETAQIDILG